MRKLLLLLSVILSAALMCAFAQAEGTIDASLLTLGLAGNPMSADDVPDALSQISSAIDGVNLVTSRAALLQEQALEPLYRLMQAAAKDGQTLYVRQAYRSYADEERRYELLSGSGQAAQKPGESSYQTGLSVTLVGEDWKTRELTADFADSSEGKWLSAHAAEYGFVLRYPQGKENVTGWHYEPWHFRYVGVSAAATMTRQGLCLEELAADSGLISESLQNIPLPDVDYTEDKPVYDVEEEEDGEDWNEEPWDEEENWDEESWDEESWDEESESWDEDEWPEDDGDEDEWADEDDIEPQPERSTNHSVPTVRDPSTIDPDDIGPDGDYEISIDNL